MSEFPFKPMGLDPRFIARIQKKGTRSELNKRLAELIKNADDAYDRLELDDKKTSGIIEVAYDKIKTKTGKGFSIRGFYVRDFGFGMSPEQAKEAYYGEKNYGSDTSGETRNGAIGVGGKDCFYNMKDCFILTVQGGVLTIIEIQTIDGQLASKVSTKEEDTLPIMEQVNQQITKGFRTFDDKHASRSGLEPITLSKNQTLAMFRLPDTDSGARPDTLVDQLRTFYTLRWILESDIRTVRLTDLANSQTQLLQHIPIPGEVLFEKTVTIPFKNVPYEVKIEFRKSEKDLKHHTSYGYGILIRDNRGAILDNQMYGFENDSAASKLFGTVIFNDWKKLYRESGGEILTDNREGLDYKHPVNKTLENHILTHLKPLIDTEREKQGDRPELNKNQSKNIRKAFDYMNKMIDKKPTVNMPQPFDVPPEGIEFESANYVLTERTPKLVKLYLNPGKVPTSSEISLSLVGDGITIQPDSIIISPVEYDSEQVPFVTIEVTGKKLVDGKETRTTLKAAFGELDAETEIYIKNETAIYPTNGFAFVPKKITIVPKKDRKIKLVIDTNLISAGTAINLTCDDDRLKFSPAHLTVSSPPNLGRYLTEEIITISSTKLGLKTTLTADTQTKMSFLQGQATSETRTSVCAIEVKEKEPPKTFFKDYELVKKGDKRVESSFRRDEGIISIHVNAPILKHAFGAERQHLDKGEPDALFCLAKVVVERMTTELAKYRVETGQEEVLDDVPTAIEGLKGDLQFEYGLHLLQTIIHGHATHEK